MSAHPDFRYPPAAPLAQPAPLTRKQLVLLILGWSAAMAVTLFLASPYGRLVFEAIWSAK